MSSKLNNQPKDAEQCSHSLRSGFFVPKDIPRNRHVKGTMSLHVVKCVEQNVLLTWALSCSCHPRLTGAGRCHAIHASLGQGAVMPSTPHWGRALSCHPCVTGAGRCLPDATAGPWQRQALMPVAVVDDRASNPPNDPLVTPLQLIPPTTWTHLKLVLGILWRFSCQDTKGPFATLARCWPLTMSRKTFIHVQHMKKKPDTDLYVMSHEGWASIEQVLRKLRAPVLALSVALHSSR